MRSGSMQAGCTSQDSPSSSWVSARSRSGVKGPTKGPISVAGLVVTPTRKLRTASASWRRNGLRSYTGARTMARLPAEHF